MLHTAVLSLVVGVLSSAHALHADSLRADREVRLVALRHASEIRQCYETQGLRVNPQLGGVVEVEVTVLPSGVVDGANISASGLAGPGHTEVEACITTVVKNWRFERGPFAVETIVYPFTLVRDAKGALEAAASTHGTGAERSAD